MSYNSRIAKLASYDECTGCGVCEAICNKNAISVQYDKNGFLHPFIDSSLCVSCGACSKVCHPLNQGKLVFHSASKIINYTSWSTNDSVSLSSASGGVFFQIAKSFLEKGNSVVYGASLSDENSCSHIAIYHECELSKIIGSKYIQSKVSKIYKQVKVQLKDGMNVLFSGTPCQIGALYAFLGKVEFPNLFTIEILCHGTPSKVISDLATKYNHADHIISYRTKKEGWCLLPFKRVCYKVIYSDVYGKKIYPKDKRDIFYRMMPSANSEACHYCNYAKPDRVSDITLGDQWQLARELPERSILGASLVLVNTEKGQKIFNDTSHLYKREEAKSTLCAQPLFSPTFKNVSFSKNIYYLNLLPLKIAVGILSLDWHLFPPMYIIYLLRKHRTKKIAEQRECNIRQKKKDLGWM